jgi:hypothetical protein
MRPPVGPGQVVGYVAPPARRGGQTTIKNGVVMETFDDSTARIDVTEINSDGSPKNSKQSAGHHTALAAYNEDKKTENTFHLLDVEPASAPTIQPAAASAK